MAMGVRVFVIAALVGTLAAAAGAGGPARPSLVAFISNAHRGRTAPRVPSDP